MKSRRFRNRSSQGSKTARKIIFRILYVLLAAAVITALTVLLGHRLLEKAREAEQSDETDTQAPGITPKNPEFDITCTKAPAVKAVLIDPDSAGTAVIQLPPDVGTPSDDDGDVPSASGDDPVRDVINRMSTYYETMILDLRGEDGKLSYSPSYVMELFGIDAGTKQDDPSLAEIKETAAYISAVVAGRGLYETTGLRICGIIPSYLDTELSGSADIADLAVIKELADIGFDEVIIDIKSIEDINYEKAVEIRKYLTSLTEKLEGKVYIGVLLPDSVYIKSANARILQVFAGSCDFICMDFDSAGYSGQKEIFTSTSLKLESLQGIIGLYNIRAVVNDSSIPVCQAEFTACEFAGLENIMVMRSLLPEDLIYDENEPDETEDTEEIPPEETAETTEEDNTNPYATVDTDVEPAETDSDGEPVETDLPWF